MAIRPSTGLGDLQIGIKYRFLKETEDWPQLGIYPMLMVPTGRCRSWLGQRQCVGELPLWAQKSWGKWTTYGGIGFAINPAAGHNNYLFGGWLLQRKVTEKLTLGGEIYCQGAEQRGASPCYHRRRHFTLPSSSTWAASTTSMSISTSLLGGSIRWRATEYCLDTWAYSTLGSCAEPDLSVITSRSRRQTVSRANQAPPRHPALPPAK